jgi:hypothetical protein
MAGTSRCDGPCGRPPESAQRANPACYVAMMETGVFQDALAGAAAQGPRQDGIDGPRREVRQHDAECLRGNAPAYPRLAAIGGPLRFIRIGVVHRREAQHDLRGGIPAFFQAEFAFLLLARGGRRMNTDWF